MQINDNTGQTTKKYYFPLRNPDNPYDVTLIPLENEKQYREINRIINRKRKREQRAGRCICKKKNLWMCSADCDVCPFHTSEGHLSLDMGSENADGDTSSLLDYLQDEYDFTEEIENEELEKAMHLAIHDLSSEDQDIISLYMEGLSERDIAHKIGCSQKKVNYRKKAIFQILVDKLQGWL